MSSEVQNVQFTTTNGHVVVVKPFITGWDKMSLAAVTIELPEEATKTERFMAWTKKTIEISVVSVDGVAEDVASLVLNLNNQDSEEILSRVRDLTQEKKSEPTEKKA